MHLLVIGASRGIGLETVRQALDRGHRVRAFARSAEEIALESPQLEKYTGDATDPENVARALDGVDAVVLALGVPKSPAALMRPVSLFSAATEILVPAMREAGVVRLLVVTGFGAGASKSALSTLEKFAYDAVLGRAYADKDRQEKMVKDSGLDWTLVRPGLLVNGPARPGYKVLTEPEQWHNGMISRASVADFLVSAVESGDYLHGEVVLVR